MTARTPVPQAYGVPIASAPITIASWPTRRFPDMWVDPEDDPRETGERSRGEMGVLRRLPATATADPRDEVRGPRRRADGAALGAAVDDVAARAGAPPGGVEHSWTRRVIERHLELPTAVPHRRGPRPDFNGAVADDAVVAEAWASWRREVDVRPELPQRRRSVGELGARRRRGRRDPRHRRAPDRGVRPALRPRRPAPRVHRRPHRAVSAAVGELLLASGGGRASAVLVERKTADLDAEQLQPDAPSRRHA